MKKLFILIAFLVLLNGCKEQISLDNEDCINSITYPENYVEGKILVKTAENIDRVQFETLHERLNARYEGGNTLLTNSVEPEYYVEIKPGLEREWICAYEEYSEVESATFVVGGN